MASSRIDVELAVGRGGHGVGKGAYVPQLTQRGGGRIVSISLELAEEGSREGMGQREAAEVEEMLVASWVNE